MTLLTYADAFAGSRRQNERDSRDNGENTTGQNKVDEVVERLSTQLNRERRTRERSSAAVVFQHFYFIRNICKTSQ